MMKVVCFNACNVGSRSLSLLRKEWTLVRRFMTVRNAPGTILPSDFLHCINRSSFSTTSISRNMVLDSKSTNSGGNQRDETSEDAEDRKKQENAARALKFTLATFGILFLGGAGYVYIVWGSPPKDVFGNDIQDEFSKLPLLLQYFKRAINQVRNYKTFLAEPSREKLLPDPVKYPYIQPPYTLLLEIRNVLVDPEWSYRTGWRFKKRPGVDYFLTQVAAGHNFEIVIFTQESGFTAFPIVDALDSQKVVMYSLFRDSTRYVDGHHIKDLDRINRDLNRVIMVDCSENSVSSHRSNALVLPKWEGDDNDRTLFDLAALLRTISNNEVHDVREVLNYYAKFGDPISEFKRKRREYEEQQEQLNNTNLKPKLPGTLNASFNFFPNFWRKQ